MSYIVSPRTVTLIASSAAPDCLGMLPEDPPTPQIRIDFSIMGPAPETYHYAFGAFGMMLRARRGFLWAWGCVGGVLLVVGGPGPRSGHETPRICHPGG